MRVDTSNFREAVFESQGSPTDLIYASIASFLPLTRFLFSSLPPIFMPRSV